jgi:hypothetical protein
MLVLGAGLLIFRGIYLNSVPASVLPADAAAAAFDAFFHFLKNGLRVVLVAGLVAAIGAFFTGPSRAAAQTRSGITSGIDWVRHYGERRGSPPARPGSGRTCTAGRCGSGRWLWPP